MTKIRTSAEVAYRKEIGVEETAKILGYEVERVMRVLEVGELRSKRVGGKPRMLLGDVLNYKLFVRQRRKSLAFLVKQAQELKLGYQ
ncbi:MAG: hypothetical protein WDO15_14770 [Bacteroidota bacterium]